VNDVNSTQKTHDDRRLPMTAVNSAISRQWKLHHIAGDDGGTLSIFKRSPVRIPLWPGTYDGRRKEEAQHGADGGRNGYHSTAVYQRGMAEPAAAAGAVRGHY